MKNGRTDVAKKTEERHGKAIAEVVEVFVDGLHDSPFNPRKTYPEKELKELAESIKTHGIQSPILVRPREGTANVYEIIFGHRRVKAARLADVEYIPAMVQDMNDEEAREAQIVENLEREDLPPMEEAHGFDDYMTSKNCGPREVAERFGKEPSYVARRVQLVHLIADAADALNDGKFPLTAALELCRLQPDEQKEAFDDITVFELENDTAENIAAKIRDSRHQDLTKAPFDLEDPDLVEEAGACTECFCFSGKDPDLFNDLQTKTCTKGKCYKAKVEAQEAREVEKAKAKGYEVITGPEARSIVNVWGGQNYAKLTDPCLSDPKRRKWEDLIGKDAELKKYMAVYAGKFAKVFSVKELLKCAKAAGHDFEDKAAKAKKKANESDKHFREVLAVKREIRLNRVEEATITPERRMKLVIAAIKELCFSAEDPLEGTSVDLKACSKAGHEDELFKALAFALEEKGAECLGINMKDVEKEAEKRVKETEKETEKSTKKKTLKAQGTDAKNMAKKIKAFKAEVKAKKKKEVEDDEAE